MALQSLLLYMFILSLPSNFFVFSYASCSKNNGECKEVDVNACGECEEGFYCFGCLAEFKGPRCVRSSTTNQFKLLEPAIDTLRETETFLSSNPTEIVTLILEDYVKAPKGLTKVFTEAGLMKYWFPLSRMPTQGQDWPLVSDMVTKNHRLIVFTSMRSKQQTEGIAYQWDYMVENQYGDGGMKEGNCTNRAESSALNVTTKSLVLVNYFRVTMRIMDANKIDNSAHLMDMLRTCHDFSGNRWANFVAVDYYKRSEGGGAFQALDMLNGELLCGRDEVHACEQPGVYGGASNNTA